MQLRTIFRQHISIHNHIIRENKIKICRYIAQEKLYEKNVFELRINYIMQLIKVSNLKSINKKNAFI